MQRLRGRLLIFIGKNQVKTNRSVRVGYDRKGRIFLRTNLQHIAADRTDRIDRIYKRLLLTAEKPDRSLLTCIYDLQAEWHRDVYDALMKTVDKNEEAMPYMSGRDISTENRFPLKINREGTDSTDRSL